MRSFAICLLYGGLRNIHDKNTSRWKGVPDTIRDWRRELVSGDYHIEAKFVSNICKAS